MDFAQIATEVAAILARRGFPRDPSDGHGWFWITPERLNVRPKNRVELTEGQQHDLHLHRAACTSDGFTGDAQTSVLHNISPVGIAELIQLSLRHINHIEAARADG